MGCLQSNFANAAVVKVPVPTNQTYLGLYVNETGATNRTGIQAEVSSVEARLGRKLDIDSHFDHWDWSFPGWAETWDVANGRIPMVSWGRVKSTDVTSGSQDSLIVQRARAVASFGRPMFIRWSAEMEGGANVGYTGTPSQFIAAWRRIHSLFVANGATNVSWVWCPNASSFATGVAQSYYPGDTYVDWVCADGYNWAPRKQGGATGGTWRSFQTIFSSFYAWASGRSKPIMIGETGAQEGTGSTKATWIKNMGATIMNTFPKIRALVYFDSIGGSNGGGTFNWRVTSSASASQAWTSLARLGWFKPRH